MDEIAGTPTATKTTRRRATALDMLWSGWAASVPAVFLATIAVLAVPHARGIGFFPVLRHAVVTPACVLIAVASAFLYRPLSERSGWPRQTLAAILFGVAAVVLAAMAIGGPPGLAGAAWPALVVVAAVIAWLVPRLVDRPRRSRVATVAIVVFGTIEAVGVFGAVSGEGVEQTGPEQLASGIPRTMFDVDHRFVVLPSGARVHYVDEGRGETLLFLHGNPAWSFQWRDLVHALRGSYRCVALDYPGFGLSQAPPGFGFTPREESRVVEEFVDHLELRDVTLVMQDWGGPIGIGLAERRPELVCRVVLGSTWAWPTGTSEPRGKWSLIAGGPVGEFAQVNFNGIVKFGVKQSIVRGLPPDIFEMYVRPFRPVGRRGIAAFYPGQITAADDYFAELEAGLPLIKEKPALIFWALKDPGFPRADLTRFEAAFPDHKTIELPDASHFFFEDAADRMIQEIRAFMIADPNGRGRRDAVR
jgi:pimeloyl-ACP methyl ester carboxylesterase